MNAAQALLHQVRQDMAWDALHPHLREAIREELERADTTPTHTEPIHRTDPDAAWKAGPVVGEQTMRRFGLVRDEVRGDDPFDPTDHYATRIAREDHVKALAERDALNAEIDAAGKGD